MKNKKDRGLFSKKISKNVFNKIYKKGVIEDSIRPIIGTVIAGVLILFVIIPLGIMLYNIFFDKVNQGTMESLNAINQKIRTTESQKSSSVAVHINNGIMLVGFNAGSGSITLQETCCLDDELRKPQMCGASACLCLCEEGDCTQPIKCVVFSKDESEKTDEEKKANNGGVLREVGVNRKIKCFIGPDKSPNYGEEFTCSGASGKGLVLYGNCNCDTEGDFGVRTLKLTNYNDERIHFEFKES